MSGACANVPTTTTPGLVPPSPYVFCQGAERRSVIPALGSGLFCFGPSRKRVADSLPTTPYVQPLFFFCWLADSFRPTPCSPVFHRESHLLFAECPPTVLTARPRSIFGSCFRFLLQNSMYSVLAVRLGLLVGPCPVRCLSLSTF